MNKPSNEKYGRLSALLLSLIAACIISGAGITNYYNLPVLKTGTSDMAQSAYAATPSVFGEANSLADNSNNDTKGTTSDNLNANDDVGTNSNDDESDDEGSDDQTSSDDSGSDDQTSSDDQTTLTIVALTTRQSSDDRWL